MYQCDRRYHAAVSAAHFEELKALSPDERFAARWQYMLRELPVHVLPTDRIVGWFGYEEGERKMPADEPAFPFAVPVTEADEERTAFLAKCGIRVSYDRGHLCTDYEYILRNGLKGYEAQIDEKLAKGHHMRRLGLMKQVLLQVRAFSERMACAAETAMRECPASERERFRQMAETCRRVPYGPARNFREALQSVWVIHFLIPLADNVWASISLGRFDRYMLPYYRRDAAAGVPKEEIVADLRNFYELLNGYADAACALNVGGESDDGEEYNELSRLLIACQKDFALAGPILAARVSENTPDDIMDELVDVRLFERGQPTFYFEEPCRRVLEGRGIPSETALHFNNNSCMGISLAGQEINSMWGCVFKMPAALEMALRGGSLFTGKASLELKEALPPLTDTDALLCRVRLYAAALLERALPAYEKLALVSEKNDPNLFAEILTADCISCGEGRLEGVRYHNVTVECFGLANAADGIAAVEELAFRQKKYTVEELIRAAEEDYAGHEGILRDVLACPKYGQDGPADRFAAWLADMMADLAAPYDHGNVWFLPSLHTLEGNVWEGACWGAGVDGRRAGEPFAKNAGPCNGVRTASPTAMLRSAAALPQQRFSGGQPVDVHFDAAMVERNRRQVAQLIRAYGRMGGLQMQVNAISSRRIAEAIAHPETAEDLIVRIGGYSIRFNRLSEPVKREFYQRFRREEGYEA